MKKINYALAILACALLALSATSCKDNKIDDPIDDPISNHYTLDGTTYPILTAGIKDLEGGDFWFIISRFVITDNFMASPESYIQFIINEEDFGKTSSDVDQFYMYDEEFSIQYYDAKSGTIKVVKDGDNYTVDFDFAFEDNEDTEHRLTGHYSGAPEVVLR